MNARALTWTAALSGIGAALAWQFRDLITDKVLVETLIILAVAVASIGFSWVVTEVFKRVKYPNPDDWSNQRGRLWLCSIIWNFAVNGGVLVLRYQQFELTRDAFETLAYILIWTVLVAGIGIAAYDVFVRRLWHRMMRRFFPTKYVQTPAGVQERDEDQPSGPHEKTVMRSRDTPKDPPA